MGLDMYLSKKTYVKNWNHTPEEKKHKITIKQNGKQRSDIKADRITHIVEEVMYWRKANHIHHWFVENCQNGEDECQETYVSREKLKELAELCEKVVETKNGELLPTQSGFFFGSTEYDEYYFDECKQTAKTIRELLKENSEDSYNGDFYYQSSW